MHWFGWKRGFDAVDVVSVEVTVDDVVEEARCVVMFAPMSSPTVPSPSPLSFKSALLALPLLSPEPPLPPRSSIIVVVAVVVRKHRAASSSAPSGQSLWLPSHL